MSNGTTRWRRQGLAVGVLLRWSVILLALACCLGASPTLASAETRKATGTVGSVVLVARTEIFMASVLLSGHLESRSRGLLSQDPDWNHAMLFSTSFMDPAMQLERQARGHMVITHPGGDQMFLQYDATWKNVGPIEIEWQILGRFVRGTGRFKGITGTWRERVKSTSTGDSGDWETEYTLR
jgi:hypothetical protein